MPNQPIQLGNKGPAKMKEYLEKIRNIYAPHPDPADIDSALQTIRVGLVQSLSIEELNKYKGMEAVMINSEILQKKRDVRDRSAYVLEKYQQLYSVYKSLIDIKKQEAAAETWTGWKMVFFRTLTALSIAAVVLGTAYIAKEYNIPLPMLSRAINQ
jgi:hypothetical protein